jgi:Putative bacterial sensory transduction regulator
MRVYIAVVAAFALALMMGTAKARDIPTGGFTSDDVVAWLQGQGYKAQIKNQNGKKSVVSAADGVEFQIDLYDCKGDRCGSMQFTTAWATHGHFDTTKMNDWNRNERWARGFFDSSNDPWLQYDVDLTPGGTYELLNDQFAIWNKLLSSFIKRYGL